MAKFAVIDIGSNTVRLVVYENRERAPYVIFNEKVFCGLGRGVAVTGSMPNGSMDRAVTTLKRFSILLKKMDIFDPSVVATSAVRDAQNSPIFIARVLAETELSIEVIDGKQEAYLSACGVICAVPHATGIIADLGGGSLELAVVDNKNVSHETTLAIGPLQLQDKKGKKLENANELIDDALTSVPWTNDFKDRKFYAVGGAWRTLARIHMHETNYPLINMHNYIIPMDQVLDLTKRISQMSAQELEKYRPHISKKRIKILSLASLVLYRLLISLQPSKFVVSAFGVREGILYNEMKPRIKNKDPLIVGCYQVAKMTGRFAQHGQHLNDWIDGLFSDETEEHIRLRLAICILCDVGWRGHPEYRAEKVVSEILYGRLSGINHWGAAFIAIALYICYGGSDRQVKQVKTAEALISKEDYFYAKKIGLALRLAQRLSGGTSDGLKSATLTIEQDTLLLKIKPEMHDLINEIVEKYFGNLAKFLELKVKISSI